MINDFRARNFDTLNLSEKAIGGLYKLGKIFVDLRSGELTVEQGLRLLKKLSRDDFDSVKIDSAIKRYISTLKLDLDLSLSATKKHLSGKGSKIFNEVMKNAVEGDWSSRMKLTRLLTYHLNGCDELLDYAPLINDWLIEAKENDKTSYLGSLRVNHPNEFLSRVKPNLDLLNKLSFKFTDFECGSNLTITSPEASLVTGKTFIAVSPDVFRGIDAFISSWLAFLITDGIDSALEVDGLKKMERPLLSLQLNKNRHDVENVLYIMAQPHNDQYFFSITLFSGGINLSERLFDNKGLAPGKINFTDTHIAEQLKQLQEGRDVLEKNYDDSIWRAGLFLLNA